MSKPVSAKKLSTAISTLGKEAPDFHITQNMTVIDIFGEYIRREEIKARERAEQGMFDDDAGIE